MQLPSVRGFDTSPIQIDDAENWATYACLEVVKALSSSTLSSVEDVRAHIERSQSVLPGLPTRFALRVPGNAAIVSTVGFHTISLTNGTAEVSYDVTPSYWGRGIATAACRAATRWAFETAGWHRVQATMLPANVPSRRVVEKCGFLREGLVRNLRLVRGRPEDFWLYSAIPGEVTPEATRAPAE